MMRENLHAAEILVSAIQQLMFAVCLSSSHRLAVPRFPALTQMSQQNIYIDKMSDASAKITSEVAGSSSRNWAMNNSWFGTFPPLEAAFMDLRLRGGISGRRGRCSAQR